MSHRIPQLDLLRAVAILLVIGRHLELDRPNGVVGALADGWYRLGWIGVDLFFVLSGFLIGGLLISEVRSHGSLDIRRFLVRRGLKIYPPYFLFLAFLILAPVAQAALRGRGAVGELGTQLEATWPHLVFLQNYVEVDSGQHLWSLGAEEHFYVLLPFVVALLAARGSKPLVVIGLGGVALFLGLRLLSVAMQDPFSDTVSATHLRLDALLFGVAMRAMLEHDPRWFAGLRRWRVPLVVVGVACWAPNLVVETDSTWTRTGGLTLTFLGAAAFLAAAYGTTAGDLGRSRPWAEPIARGLCGMGVHSYGIYLWHVAAIGAISKVTDRTTSAWLGDGQLGWTASAAVICAGVVAVGILTSVAVERPVLRLRDRIAPSRSAALPQSAGALGRVVAPQPTTLHARDLRAAVRNGRAAGAHVGEVALGRAHPLATSDAADHAGPQSGRD